MIEEFEFTMKVFADVVPMFAAAFQANDFADRLEGKAVEPIFRNR